MGRPKGTEKTGGRVKGSLNKTTRDTKERIQSFVNENWDLFKTKLLKLAKIDSPAFVEYFFKLLPYVAAKQSEVKSDIRVEDLSSEQLSQFAAEMAASILSNDDEEGSDQAEP